MIVISTFIMVLAVGLLPPDSFSQVRAIKLPTTPPRNYVPIIPCHSQLGKLWAPPSAFQPSGGIERPMLGFYQGRLVGMVFYLSENHLYLSPRGTRQGFRGTINAPVASMTIAPAQYRPNRDRRAYELTIMVQHDPPVAVTCGSGGGQAESGEVTGGKDDAVGNEEASDIGGADGGARGERKRGERKREKRE